MSKKSTSRLLLILSIALVIRCAAVTGWTAGDGVGLRSGLLTDTDSYLRLAGNWAQSGVYGFEDARGQVTASAFRPPIYPWLLSWFVGDGQVSAAGVAGLNILLGLSAVWLTWSIGVRLGIRWAPIAGLAIAVDPILLRASQSAMTETLATVIGLIVWRLWLALWPVTESGTCALGDSLRRTAWGWAGIVGLGFAFGLAILARPTAAPWCVLCVLSMLVVGCRCPKRRLVDVVIVCVCVAVCVLPWTLRNLAQIGKPIWATSHGGYTLLLANNPLLFEHFRARGPDREWDAEPFHAHWASRGGRKEEIGEPGFWDGPLPQVSSSFRPIGEIADDGLAYQAAIGTIRSQPGQFAIACVYRMGWFWAFWPNQGSVGARTAIGIWYGLWFIAACLGGFRIARKRGLSAWLPALLLLFTLTSVHAIYWSNMRMRAPVVAAVYLLALAPARQKAS